jgi:hypothetical protein
MTARRPDIMMETVDKCLTRMYRTNPDFVFTVTRDFVRNCRTPVPRSPRSFFVAGACGLKGRP